MGQAARRFIHEGCEKHRKNDSSVAHGTKVGRGNLLRMNLATNLLDTASNVMRSEAAQSTWVELAALDLIVITAHRSPDGDAVGSVLALTHHLKEAGLNVEAVLPDRFPRNLAWLPGSDSIHFFEENPEATGELLGRAELIWCLDFNGPGRTGSMEEALRTSPAKKWVVDHHQLPEDFADHIFSDPACGSTCELVFDLIASWRRLESLSQASAICMYTGIMTDTGSFRFSSVSAHTHLVLSHLVGLGIDHARIHEQTFDQRSLNQVQLEGHALSDKLYTWMDFGVALIVLDLETLERFNYQPGDTEGVVNRALALEGIHVAIFAKESKGGLFKMSFRSTGDLSVRDIAAEHFEGGGHRNAAGGIYHGSTALSLVSHIESQLLHWFPRP